MSQNFTLDDLADAVKILAKRGQKMAPVVQWGYSQIQILTTWQTTAQGQLEDLANQVVTDDAEISTLRGQVKDTAETITSQQSQLDSLAAQVSFAAQQATKDTDIINQLTVNAIQLNATNNQQSATITALQAQIATLTAQLAAATISPLSVVMIDTHLYGFSSVDASQAFYDANSGQPKQMFKVTDFSDGPTGEHDMSEHTKEPWTIGIEGDYIVGPVDDGHAPIIACLEGYEDDAFGRDPEANARRIVACVNFLAGVSIEMLEKRKAAILFQGTWREP